MDKVYCVHTWVHKHRSTKCVLVIERFSYMATQGFHLSANGSNPLLLGLPWLLPSRSK